MSKMPKKIKIHYNEHILFECNENNLNLDEIIKKKETFIQNLKDLQIKYNIL